MVYIMEDIIRVPPIPVYLCVQDGLAMGEN